MRTKTHPLPTAPFKLLDTVVLTATVSNLTIPVGALGIIVEEFTDEIYLVEFVDDSGVTTSIEEIPADCLTLAA